MFGKFVLVCLAALCTIQGFQAGTVEQRSIADIINDFKNIIRTITEALSDIPNAIANLKKKIEDAINDFDISKIISNIQDKIDDILSNAGLDPSAARACNDAQKAGIEAMKTDAELGLAACKTETDDKVTTVVEAADKMKKAAADLMTDIHNRNDKCVKEGGIDVIKVMKCLQKQFGPIKAEADQLITEIVKTIAAINKAAIEIPVHLVKCLATVNSKILDQERAIIKELKQCLTEHTPFIM